MFERFTDRARRVVILAQDEARSFNHSYVGTEHLLLGIIKEDIGVAAQALIKSGLNYESVHDRLGSLLGVGEITPSGHLPFTPRAREVISLSLGEALRLGHQYVGPEHLLLAGIREGTGVGFQTIKTFAEPAQVRQKLIAMIADAETKKPPVSNTTSTINITTEEPPDYGRKPAGQCPMRAEIEGHCETLVRCELRWGHRGPHYHEGATWQLR